jgi:hypothetical protein
VGRRRCDVGGGPSSGRGGPQGLRLQEALKGGGACTDAHEVLFHSISRINHLLARPSSAEGLQAVPPPVTSTRNESLGIRSWVGSLCTRESCSSHRIGLPRLRPRPARDGLLVRHLAALLGKVVEVLGRKVVARGLEQPFLRGAARASAVDRMPWTRVAPSRRTFLISMTWRANSLLVSTSS